MTRKPVSASWPAFLIAGLAVLAIGLGLAVTGGPGQGRKEHRDEARLSDLDRLSAQVQCLARAADGQLPQDLAPTTVCPGELRREDPYTGQPYRYEILTDRAYRICAGFETDLAELRRGNLVDVDTKAGCIHYSLPEKD
ncbi:MAG: hypothetical protein WCD16_16715 [Paracoccaceae bacterium]